jgi:hypothetical protein
MLRGLFFRDTQGRSCLPLLSNVNFDVSQAATGMGFDAHRNFYGSRYKTRGQSFQVVELRQSNALRK